MLPISATPLPHRGKSLWSFAALYAFAKPPQNTPKTRMNSAILNSRVFLRLYKHGTLQLHNATIKYQQMIVCCHAIAMRKDLHREMGCLPDTAI